MSSVGRRFSAALVVTAALATGTGARAAMAGHSQKHRTVSAQSALTPDQRVLHVLNRLSFGPRPGDVNKAKAMGIDAWIDQQLRPGSIDDSALEARLSAYPAMQLDLHELIERFPSPAMIRGAENGRLPVPADPVEHAIYTDQIAALEMRQQNKKGQAEQAAGGMHGDASSAARQEEQLYVDLDAAKIVSMPPEQRVNALIAMPPQQFQDFIRQLRRPDRIALFAGLTPQQRETVFALMNPQLVVGSEVVATRMLRDIYSERQLEAVMTDFWLNHFNVYLRKGPFAPWYLAEYQDRVIRPHALGRFEDLLVATAQSPAMLFYLDNTESVGPHSVAAMRAAAVPAVGNDTKQLALGLNENYARELMELHTLGVNGGYTQNDVIEVAKVFSGWTIDRPNQGGGFTFNERRHEPGSKYVLRHVIQEDGEQEGLEVLHLLATSPATAHFISEELAERFVGDDPPAALVNRMAATWMKTGGEIREVLRTMLTSPEFWSKDAYRAKIKTPEEYVISAVRASGGEVQHPVALVEALAQLGMPFYGCQTPNGYPWKADAWLSSGDLLDRMNFGLALAGNDAGTVMHFDRLMDEAGDAPSTPDGKAVRLASALMHGEVSPHTRRAALDELSAQQQAAATDASPQPQKVKPVPFIRGREFGLMLAASQPISPPRDHDASILAALLLGSPDFQRR
ncbi:DUF1800 domain-containing protein [Paracidobacterium acidisoli]|uniref:DUF1800 domain-containing protein n=1 Tax=Paracidobacterium acidisoli TaxID=2303751 RepID=A0A372IQF2_9BACT|nr:DUF1800 domain-containing protein [Paracidobacterium acidisoli]MBT9331475.1 DUF1800 domain-containing protein [Paracidobacterium acidisoli]